MRRSPQRFSKTYTSPRTRRPPRAAAHAAILAHVLAHARQPQCFQKHSDTTQDQTPTTSSNKCTHPSPGPCKRFSKKNIRTNMEQTPGTRSSTRTRAHVSCSRKHAHARTHTHSLCAYVYASMLPGIQNTLFYGAEGCRRRQHQWSGCRIHH